MNGTLVWVLVGLALYWFGMLALNSQGLLPSYIGIQGPITTIHTKRGREFLDWLATPKRLWRAWGNFGLGIALVVMIGTFLLFVGQAILVIQNPPEPTSVTQPRNALVIPGVNEFLPLSMAPEILFGLFVALVVHEGGHAIFCRVENIEIESMGLALLAIFPLGAFVEPNEEDRRRADRGSQSRMFAAGVTNNFAITLVAFALLFGPVVGFITVAPGAGVGHSFPDSPAAEAGIGYGDRITAVGGNPVADRNELDGALANSTDSDVVLEVNGNEEVAVQRELWITSAVEGSGFEAGSQITAVNGESVSTVAGLRDHLRDGNETATFSLRSGNEEVEYIAPVGVRAAVAPNGPLAEAGAPVGEDIVIVSIEDQRLLDHDDLRSTIEGVQPGDKVSVVAYHDDERIELSPMIGGTKDNPLLGVQLYLGINGLELDDLGIEYYPAERYLGILGGDVEHDYIPSLTESFIGKILLTLTLPIADIAGGGLLPFNFAGFTGEVANFYEVQGSLGVFDGLVFGLANVLFWIGWVNLNLGFFNCIPAFPLDGGHILRTSAEAIMARLPIEDSYRLTKVVTITVGLTMAFALLILIFGPRYFL